MPASDVAYTTEYSGKEISEGMAPGELIKVNGTPAEIRHTLPSGPRNSHQRPDDLTGSFRLVLTGGFKHLRVWCWLDGTQSYLLRASDGTHVDVDSVELFVERPEGE